MQKLKDINKTHDRLGCLSFDERDIWLDGKSIVSRSTPIGSLLQSILSRDDIAILEILK